MKKVLFYLVLVAAVALILWLIGTIVYILIARSGAKEAMAPTSISLEMEIGLRLLMIAVIAFVGGIILYFLSRMS